MKHIFKFNLVPLIIFLCISCLSAQKEIGQGAGIIVKGTSIGAQVTLKWVPENPDLFQKARNNGYKIVRYTLTNLDGQNLSDAVYKASKVTVAQQVKPITIAVWDSITNGTHPFDSLMRFGYLSSSFDFQPSGTKLGDAFEYSEKKKNAFIYASLIADSDINLARYLGLAFIDANTSPGIKYKYFVSINGENASGAAIVEPMDMNALPVATELEAFSSDKKIKITWKSEGLDNYYTYYDIFRSDNGGTSFVKVNTEPFIYMGGDDNFNQTMTFGDDVPANGVPYTYKVRGISPFGADGPFSETITAIARPERLNLETFVNTCSFQTDGTAVITWEMLSKDSISGTPVDFTHLIDRFDVLYRVNLTDSALVLNTLPIPNTDRTFTIPAPAEQGLYFIRATDLYDYTYTSVPFLAQIKDSIPPAIPVGLTGTIRKDGRVNLQWSANTDSDLLGYKIYSTYGTNNEYTQITSDHIKNTSYITDIKSDDANDTIFYKISAVDKRYNISAKSQSIYLILPDRTPPSDPVLKRVTPTQNGVRIAWSLSESSDIKQHFLQRRFSTAVKWDNIVTINAIKPYPPLAMLPEEFEPANYIDLDTLVLRDYDYRLMAEDTSGNKSISKVITIRPYDDGSRGLIRPLISRLAPLGAVYNPTSLPPAPYGPNSLPLSFPDITDLSDPKTWTNLDPNGFRPKSPLKRVKTNVVRLEWQYETKFPSSVTAFQIYQKKPSSTPGNASQVSPANPPFILVRTVNVRDAAAIAIMNNLTGYAIFVEDIPGRKEVTTPVEYKIIALHSDGGFSMPAFTSVTLPPITF